MVIPSKYQEHAEIMKEFSDSFLESENLSRDFQKILEKSKNLKFGEAKEFLKSLLASELKTIEEYKETKLPKDLSSLSEEGAANLLLENHQIIDFDEDGKVEVGESISESFLPQDMPNTMKRDIVEAFKTVPHEEKFLLSFIISVEFNKHNKFRDISDESYVKDELLKPNYSDNTIIELLESMRESYLNGVGEKSTLEAFEGFAKEYLSRSANNLDYKTKKFLYKENY